MSLSEEMFGDGVDGRNGSFENQTCSSESHNGSFQNHKRPGMDCAVLLDVTNRSKRACKVRAADAIASHSRPAHLPRGDAAKAGRTSVSKRCSVTRLASVDSGEVEKLQEYIKENASFEVQKSIALLVLIKFCYIQMGQVCP